MQTSEKGFHRGCIQLPGERKLAWGLHQIPLVNGLQWLQWGLHTAPKGLHTNPSEKELDMGFHVTPMGFHENCSEKGLSHGLYVNHLKGGLNVGTHSPNGYMQPLWKGASMGVVCRPLWKETSIKVMHNTQGVAAKLLWKGVCMGVTCKPLWKCHEKSHPCKKGIQILLDKFEYSKKISTNHDWYPKSVYFLELQWIT